MFGFRCEKRWSASLVPVVAKSIRNPWSLWAKKRPQEMPCVVVVPSPEVTPEPKSTIAIFVPKPFKDSPPSTTPLPPPPIKPTWKAASGVYTEKLPCGSSLELKAESFRIHYYFPGSNARHKGSWVDVLGNDIDQYIQAFQVNWIEYLELKNAIPPGGQL